MRRQPNVHARSTAAQLKIATFEPLEGRTMFSGVPLVIAGTPGPDTIRFHYTRLAQGNWTYIVNINGKGADFFDYPANSVYIYGMGGDDHIIVDNYMYVPITVNGGDGNDTIQLPGVGGNLPITVYGGAGTNALRLGAEADNRVQPLPGTTFTYDVTDHSVSRGGIQNNNPLHPWSGQPITYQDVQSLLVRTDDANDVVRVHSTAIGTNTAIVGGPGVNAFTVGDGNLAPIAGHLTLEGAGGNDSLAFNDWFGAGNTAYTLNAAQLLATNGMGGVDFYNIERQTLTANAFDNIININGVSTFADLTVNGYGGDDRCYVSNRNIADQIRGSLHLFGGSGSNSVQFDDQDSTGTNAYALSDGCFQESAAAPKFSPRAIDFLQMQSAAVAGNMAANVFSVTPSAITRFIVYGRGPNPGDATKDVLNLNVASALNPVLIPFVPGMGTYTFANRQPVVFSSVEQVNLKSVTPLFASHANADFATDDARAERLARRSAHRHTSVGANVRA